MKDPDQDRSRERGELPGADADLREKAAAMAAAAWIMAGFELAEDPEETPPNSKYPAAGQPANKPAR